VPTRRAVLAGAAGALAPLVLRAQDGVRRLGVLSGSPENDPVFQASSAA